MLLGVLILWKKRSLGASTRKTTPLDARFKSNSVILFQEEGKMSQGDVIGDSDDTVALEKPVRRKGINRKFQYMYLGLWLGSFRQSIEDFYETLTLEKPT